VDLMIITKSVEVTRTEQVIVGVICNCCGKPVEQDKLDRSRPIYNQQPAQIIQQPAPIINQPAPQQTFPRNCTSNTIGNYTYTNCY